MAFFAGAAAPILEGLNETGLLQPAWAGLFYRAPAVLLAAACGAGLALQALARGRSNSRELAYRRSTVVLMILFMACAGVSLSGFGAALSSLPDYLLLIFFGVTLYYRERLVFFDALVKGGVFLATGLAIVTLWVSIADRSPAMLTAGFLLCWLTAPWAYRRIEAVIDRVWLRRAWPPAEAERRFAAAVQAAASENELREQAAGSLQAIFRAPAEVSFDPAASCGADHSAGEDLIADLRREGVRLGHVRLGARMDGIPYLSGDRRLLESLARSLEVVLENIRLLSERQRHREQERELRWLAGRAELRALRAQINPHFLFNALSVIGGLLRYQPELADETIERLAQVFRYTLRKSESEWVPLGEEVEFVTAYLRIEQARFGERLRLELDVDPAAERCQIPAMTIQPLVENAIKHGISVVEGSGKVGLRISGMHSAGPSKTPPEPALLVEVLDSGPGFPQGFSLETLRDGHGLRNVAERLRGYYGDRAQLSWQNGPCTRVAFTIPCAAPFEPEDAA
jgi:two-component sensor histidine kinase